MRRPGAAQVSLQQRPSPPSRGLLPVQEGLHGRPDSWQEEAVLRDAKVGRDVRPGLEGAAGGEEGGADLGDEPIDFEAGEEG